MKVGLRKPSPRKSLAARTTGKMKRRIKKAVNPFYGKKGMGFINDPKRAVRGAVYRRTTFGVSDVVKAASKTSKSAKKTKTTRPPKAAPAQAHGSKGQVTATTQTAPAAVVAPIAQSRLKGHGFGRLMAGVGVVAFGEAALSLLLQDNLGSACVAGVITYLCARKTFGM